MTKKPASGKAAQTGRGGVRPGAGRPPKAPYPSDGALNTDPFSDPAVFLLAALNDATLDIKLRLEAARSVLPFTHQRLNWRGVKANKLAEAEKASQGKFAPSNLPTLVRSKGKPV